VFACNQAAPPTRAAYTRVQRAANKLIDLLSGSGRADILTIMDEMEDGGLDPLLIKRR
jgi:hypothetical protein